MAIHLALGVKLEQILAQRIELVLGIGPPIDENWLTGSLEDLSQLLTEEPQLDDKGRLRYVISGGWAVELMTGKQREHHDLDIITVSRKPFMFKVDEQSAKNYFQTISITNNELLEKHVVETEVNFDKNYSGLKLGTINIITTSPEFLFLSKIAGFKKEPREKDLDDLESLSLLKHTYSVSDLHDLIGHIIGLQPYFQDNAKLFKDLGVEAETTEGARVHAARYLIDIIKNFREGNKEAARMQAKRFHSTLTKTYERGLEDAIYADKDIDNGIASKFITEKKIDAFYVVEGGNPKLAIMPTKKSIRSLPKLKLWSKVQRSAPEYDLEDITQVSSKLSIAKFSDGTKEVYKILKELGDPLVNNYFKEIKRIKILERLDHSYLFGIPEKNSTLKTGIQVFDNNGKFLFDTNADVYPRGFSDYADDFADKMVKLGEYQNFLTFSNHLKDRYNEDIGFIAENYIINMINDVLSFSNRLQPLSIQKDNIDKIKRSDVVKLKVDLNSTKIKESVESQVYWLLDARNLDVSKYLTEAFSLDAKKLVGDYIDCRLSDIYDFTEHDPGIGGLRELENLSKLFGADKPSLSSVDIALNEIFLNEVSNHHNSNKTYVGHTNRILNHAKKFGYEKDELIKTKKSIHDYFNKPYYNIGEIYSMLGMKPLDEK